MKKTILATVLYCTCSAVFGADKYCAKNGNDVTVHIFGSSFSSEMHKRDFLRGMDSINGSLNVGDSLKILVHKTNGDHRVTLEACVPGCPETSLVESFTAECSAQIAKKDRAAFNSKLVGSVKAAAKLGTDGYSVFDDLVALSDYYRGRTSANQDIYVFHSLVPAGLANSATQSDYDRSFVNLVQNQKALPEELPQLSFVNSDTSKLNYEFWTDIQKLVKSGSMNFTTLD